MRVSTYDEGKKRNISAGHIEDKVFYKNVNNNHFMIKYNGYGIQKEVMERLVKEGVRDIIIRAKISTFKSTITTWVTRGKTDNQGHGEQIFLNINFMEKI